MFGFWFPNHVLILKFLWLLLLELSFFKKLYLKRIWLYLVSSNKMQLLVIVFPADSDLKGKALIDFSFLKKGFQFLWSRVSFKRILLKWKIGFL